MVQDTTECKRAEADRRESKERFRSVLATVPDLIFVLDAEGRYRHIFTAGPELLVKPADVLLGQSNHDVLPPDDARSIAEAHAGRLTAEANPEGAASSGCSCPPPGTAGPDRPGHDTRYLYCSATQHTQNAVPCSRYGCGTDCFRR